MCHISKKNSRTRLSTLICVPYYKLRTLLFPFPYFERNFCSLIPIFGGRTTIMIKGNAQYRLLTIHKNKQNVALIFIVPEIFARFGMFSGTMKIGLRSFFEWSITQLLHTFCLYTKKSVRLCNLGAKLPILSIFQANPCWLKTHPKMGYVFAPTQFWVTNIQYWEFSAHIALAIVSRDP